jgi:acetolactate synthase I/II/III large subunit
MPESTVAQAFARALCAIGVRRVYGLPGEDHLRLLDAVERAGLVYVAARDETSAVIMAAAEAQASGLPGVVMVTIAPGLTNAINGIAHAHLDGIPLIVITGQHNPERAPLIIRQSLDNHALLQSVTKWTTSASRRIHQVLARALDTAMAPRPGPVLFELRDDVAGQAPTDTAADWPLLQSPGRTLRLARQAASRTADGLDQVRSLLTAATRPSIVVGGCPTDAVALAALIGLAGCLRAPILTSPSALGAVSLDEPWFAGTFLNGNFERRILETSDVILSVGLDAKDFFNAAWAYRGEVIAINTAADTQRFVPAQHQIVGDAADILEALTPPDGGRASEWTVDDVRAYRATIEQAFRLTEAAFTIPTALCAARQVLPPETLVAVDAGFGKPIASYLWSAPSPNMYFTAHGLSTMGYAIPAANALQMTATDRPVVAFMGDGSLLMRATEMTVAAQHGSAPIYVAWLDRSLAQIELKQARQALGLVGTRVPDVACVRIADAFGGVGFDVETLDDFRHALEQALRSQVPTLIGARVDQSLRAEWFEAIRG